MEVAVDVDATEYPGYISCMFCTARCFKLHASHGAVKASSKVCAGSGSSRSRESLQAGAQKNSSNRKHRAPFFVKTVKITTVRKKNCELHLPAFFFKDYGDMFQKFVLLQGPSGQVWPVNLCVSCGSTTGRPTVRFSRGWKEFANDHHLELGDKLIFTLASFSRFSVQVFDPLGKKKQTSSTAVSGWSFRREDLMDDEISRKKKSIFVNWQNKIVRESTPVLGGNDVSKKSAVAGNGHASRMAMLCRHLKQENKKMEKRNALIAKFRTRSQEKSIPLSLLGQKVSLGSGSASSSDSDGSFYLNDEQDYDTKLLDWEPLEIASPSRIWPLAFNSNDSSTAIVTAQQQNSVVDSRTQPVNLSRTSSPSSPTSSKFHGGLENSEQGQCRSNIVDRLEDEKDLLQACWKRNLKSTTSTAWPSGEMRHDVQPSPRSHVFNVRPISALEGPHEIDAVCTPLSPTLSLSHYLESSSPEAVQSRHGPESRQLQQRFSFSNQDLAVRNHSDYRGHRTRDCSDNSGSVSEDLTLQSIHAQSAKIPIGGISNSSNRSSVTIEKCTHWSRIPLENRQVRLFDSAHGIKSSRVKETNVPSSKNLSSDLELRTQSSSKMPLNSLKPTSSRNDLSLAYFLNQPRPNARRQSHGEERIAADQFTGGTCTDAKGSISQREVDHVVTTMGPSLQKTQKIVSFTDALPSGAVSLQNPLDVRSSDKSNVCRNETTLRVEKAGQMQRPAELPETKTARCCANENFNICTTSSESKENIPTEIPASIGPLVVFNSSARVENFPNEVDRFQQKELGLTSKRGGKENIKSSTKRNRTENRVAPLVLTDHNRNPHHQKMTTITNVCANSPTKENKPALPHRKDVGITEYLEQKRIARKTRPRLKKKPTPGVSNVAVSQIKAVFTTEDIKPFVNASSNFQLDSSSRIRSQINASNSRKTTPMEEKVQKLGGTFGGMERAQTSHMKSSIGNRCDLVELDSIASEDNEDSAGGDIFEVEESWDTWREIIRQRDAASSHHLRTPVRLKPR